MTNRGYSMNDRLEFILTVIRQDYTLNNLLEFILTMIPDGIRMKMKTCKARMDP